MLSALLLATLAYTELDTFLASRRELPVPGPLDPVTQRLVAGGRVSHFEPRLGVPTFFWAERQPSPPDLRAVGLTPEEAARRALFTYAPLYRADPVALAEAPLKHVHDRGTGAVVVQFEHREGGVPVFHERLNVVLTQRLELVGLSGARAPFPWLRRDFKLAADTALAVAFEALSPEPVRFHPEGRDAAGAQRFSAPTLSMARAQQVLFPDPDAGELLSAWYVELETANDLLGTVVSALDGRVLWRRSLTAADSYGYRVWADPATKRPLDGPNGRATPHPTGAPDGTRFPFVAPALITLEHAGLSTNDPWLGPGATETTGNNAEAYADLVDPDGFNTGDVRGGVSAPGVFGDTFDPTTAPDTATQRRAGLAQLFYTVNWLHDWFYDSGFDESAGNAQTLNYGRGGFEGDSIKAEGQDRGGINNANMSTPADGARPRMQMYLWTPASLSRVSASSIPLDVSAAAAAFGPATFDLSMQAVLANDSTAPTSDGCQPLTTNVAGKIAVLDRGTCTFKVKALNAQNAGAVGVLLINSASPMLNTLADDTAVTTPITIPTQMVTQADGATLRTALGAATVTVRMTRASPPNRDGSVDNTVVAHEWGHYLSNRLVPGLGTQQARGLGEGWGDFVALMLTTEEADAQVAANANFGGAYALAVWDMDSPLVTTNATYFGIRRAPYSVDFTKNGLTFRHIATDEPLPMMPTSITAADNAEVHNTGEVWAAMLWEGYVALLRATPRLTFAQAQQRMQRYLVAGLKLTPGEPTFTEARDGVLAAAAAEDLADYRLLAQAFARRGLGIKAVSPPRTAATNSPLTADFTTGNDVAFVSATLDDEAFYCDRDGVLDVGERGRLRAAAGDAEERRLRGAERGDGHGEHHAGRRDGDAQHAHLRRLRLVHHRDGRGGGHAAPAAQRHHRAAAHRQLQRPLARAGRAAHRVGLLRGAEGLGAQRAGQRRRGGRPHAVALHHRAGALGVAAHHRRRAQPPLRGRGRAGHVRREPREPSAAGGHRAVQLPVPEPLVLRVLAEQGVGRRGARADRRRRRDVDRHRQPGGAHVRRHARHHQRQPARRPPGVRQQERRLPRLRHHHRQPRHHLGRPVDPDPPAGGG